MCVAATGKNNSHLLKGCPNVSTSTDIPLFQTMKKEEGANGYIARKALSRGKYLSDIGSKHTTKDGIQSCWT